MTLKKALLVLNGSLLLVIIALALVTNSRSTLRGVASDDVNAVLGLSSLLVFGGSTVLVIALKGRPAMATIAALSLASILGAWLGIFLGLIGLIDFAKPGSWWASKYYDDELLARAELNFAKRAR